MRGRPGRDEARVGETAEAAGAEIPAPRPGSPRATSGLQSRPRASEEAGGTQGRGEPPSPDPRRAERRAGQAPPRAPAPGPRGGRRPAPSAGRPSCHPRRPRRETAWEPRAGQSGGPRSTLNRRGLRTRWRGPACCWTRTRSQRRGGAGEGPLSQAPGRTSFREEGAELAGETEQKAGASALADVDGNLLKSFRTVAFVARTQKKCKQMDASLLFFLACTVFSLSRCPVSIRSL